jgi:hypothetical protein
MKLVENRSTYLVVQLHNFSGYFKDINPVFSRESIRSLLFVVFGEDDLDHLSHLQLGADRDSVRAIVHDGVRTKRDKKLD